MTFASRCKAVGDGQQVPTGQGVGSAGGLRFSSAKIPPIDVAFFQHKPGILTSAEPETLRKGENYILFLKRDRDDFVLITPFHGVVWTGGFRSSSHLIAAAEQVKQLFKVLEETRPPDKPADCNSK